MRVGWPKPYFFGLTGILEQISNLRVIVKEARQKLAKMMNKDFQVIEEALQGKRFTQLQCKRYDVDTAKKELNEDVCVEHKRLNHYIHQKVSGITIIDFTYNILRNAACEDLKISDFD